MSDPKTTESSPGTEPRLPIGSDGAGAQPGGADSIAESLKPLSRYELLVCVCGGIAAYKIATVVSSLVQDGCGVTVATTRNARRFVGSLTFQALTGRPVQTSPWIDDGSGSRGASNQRHLNLTEIADLVLVAPATANVIGKLAAGIADDLVSTLLLGADCPAIIAPAMNTRMWQHPSVQRNVAFLREAGYVIVGPEAGWLACRTIGAGRMTEAAELVEITRKTLLRSHPRATSIDR